MARFKLEVRAVKGTRSDTIAKAIEVFRAQKGIGSVSATKMPDNPTRAERLQEAAGMIDEAKSIVQELQEEMQNWYDNMPENLQNSDKASQIQEAADALDGILNSLEEADCDSVEFPGMY
jgi:hypothetical protein